MNRKFRNNRLPNSLDYETTNERPVYTYIGFFEEDSSVYKTALDKLKTANEESNRPSIGDWVCKSCLYEKNDILRDKCRICAVPKDPQWLCGHCTKFNYMEFQLCTNCNNPRNSLDNEKKQTIKTEKKTKNVKKEDIVNISRTKSNDMWICTQCSLENTYANAICIACYMFNEKLEHTSRINTDYWKCEMCTFENNIKNDICEICKGLKPKENPKSTDSLRKRKLNRFLPVNYNSCDEQLCQRTYCIETELFEKRKYDDRLNGFKEWKAMVTLLKKSHKKFVDEKFPANTRSLFYNGKFSQNKSNEELNAEMKQINAKQIVWSRPNKLASTESDANIEWQLFRTPLASDISQGILGDCWLLSALSVIAEQENLVRDIFITPEITKQGIYSIRLCKDGDWTNVIIDDLLPCNKNGMLLYSQAKRKQLWVPLIEKAIAKLYGCYESLVSGRSIEGLAILTGAPCESISLYSKSQPEEDNEEFDIEMIWAKLLSSHQAMFLMGASCGGGLMIVDEKEWKQKGLRPRHAYAVLDVRDIRGCRLLQMRNPWGHYSWTGDWSDNSILWSPELRELLMPLGASEGIFWISFEDVLKYFDSIDICKTRMNYSEIRLKGVLPSYSKPDSITCFLLTIYEMTEVYLNLFQKGQRDSEKSKRQQLDLCIAIFESVKSNNRKKGSKSTYMLGSLIEHSKRKVHTFVSCEKMLEPNTYIVLCMAFNHWGSIPVASNDAPEFPDSCLVLQSSKRVIVEKFVPDNYILADVIIALTLKHGKLHEGREGMTAYYLTKGWAGLVVVVENRHSNKWIHVKCDCQESFNVVSTRGSLITVDSVPPLHRQVIIVLTQLGSGFGFSISHRLVHRLANQKALLDWTVKGNLKYKCDNKHFPIIDTNIRGLHDPRRFS